MSEQISISKKELKKLIKESIEENLSHLVKKKYYTHKEVCDMFNIDRVTLYQWVERGIIPQHSFRDSRRNYYKAEDIENALIRTN